MNNNRTQLTFAQTGKILQTDSYYPFGMTIADLSQSILPENTKNKHLCN